MTITAKWIWSGAAAAAAVLASAAAYGILGSDQTITELPEEPVSSYAVHAEDVRQQLAAENEAAAALPEPDALPDSGYLLKLRGDVLYIYEEGVREPVAEYDLPADWLPDYDRVLLEYGIRAENKDALRQLIEDYVS